ncbi:MAG: 4-hydroxy-tetrahydrodipicolinate synthase [Clostridia bacterium]|nr:4-hydroxy-tetrahydrodipicolinate synthase [Clostridia bacterium]
MQLFTGAGVALVTPFTENGVDFDSYGRLIDFQIENGTDALIVCGTTGEPSTMTAAEKQAVIEFAINRADHRVPVIASTGGNNTAEVIRASRAAEEAGADGLLIVTPYYNKATQNGLIAHYTAVAESVNLPIIIYNVPGRTGLNMLPATLEKLSHIDNIVGMKEASGNMAQVMEMIRLCQGRISLYSGEDGLILPTMAAGGQGVISVVSNILPRDTHELTAAVFRGDLETARKIQYALNPIIDLLFCEVNPIPVKAALGLMGMINPRLRLPLTDMEPAHLAALKAAMEHYGMQL